MAKKKPETKQDKKARRAAEVAQPPLIPMDDAEVRTAGKKLAAKVADLEEMELEHDDERRRFREDESKLRGEIAAIASTIRNAGR